MSAAPPIPMSASSTYQPLDSLSGVGGTSRHLLEQAVAGEIHAEDLFGVTVKVIGASNLMAADLFTRSSDPYVVLTLDGVQHKSRIIKKCLDPEWNETFTWIVNHRPTELKMEVFDWDQVGKHDSLGSKTMNIETMGLNAGLTYEGDVRLEGPKVKHGMIKVFIESLPVPNTAGRTTGEMTGVQTVEDIVSLIDLRVVGADVTHKRELFKTKPDPFATVSFGLHQFKTAMVPSTNSPTWNQLCPLWVTQSDNNQQAVLKIAVWDYEKLGKPRLIGNAYLRPSTLEHNKPYELNLPLSHEDAQTDAQLNILMQGLNLAEVEAIRAQTTSPATAGSPSASSPPPAEPVTKHQGLVRLNFTLKPREQVEEEFYAHLIEDYDTDGSNSMSLPEITHMLTTIGVKELSTEEIEQAFQQADVNKVGALTVPELKLLFRTPIFESKKVLRHLYTVILYGTEALDSLLMKGCLTGSNTNLKPDEDATVDNEGTQIMVQDRESGMVVRENIPSYIKSALVLLNRTWVGKLASSKIKGTIKKLTIRQGKKMDDPKSKKDIPNFIKIHRLNVDEIEKPISEYKTFNEFFYRRLKPGARKCFEEGKNEYAVSPADCRMNCFRSIEDSKKLWIKGHAFTLGNLFGGWDPEGKMASKFNGGSLTIARLAPQDYHRFHSPVTGKLQRRYLIQGDYNTVSPIAVRKEVDVYTDNKRCICPIETQEFGLVILIAIAATMVGSIGFDCTCEIKPAGSVCCEDGRCQAGKEVKKFGDLGWFAFGGSTTLVLFQPGTIQFDADLLKNSDNQLETLVKVGASIGKATGLAQKPAN